MRLLGLPQYEGARQVEGTRAGDLAGFEVDLDERGVALQERATVLEPRCALTVTPVLAFTAICG